MSGTSWKKKAKNVLLRNYFSSLIFVYRRHISLSWRSRIRRQWSERVKGSHLFGNWVRFFTQKNQSFRKKAHYDHSSHLSPSSCSSSGSGCVSSFIAQILGPFVRTISFPSSSVSFTNEPLFLCQPSNLTDSKSLSLRWLSIRKKLVYLCTDINPHACRASKRTGTQNKVRHYFSFSPQLPPEKKKSTLILRFKKNWCVFFVFLFLVTTKKGYTRLYQCLLCIASSRAFTTSSRRGLVQPTLCTHRTTRSPHCPTDQQ